MKTAMNNNHPQSDRDFNTYFDKALGIIRSVSMTAEEKKAMLSRIMSDSPASAPRRPLPAAPVKSPWTMYSFSAWIDRNRWSYAVIAVLIMSLAGSGVALAAESSLPGDLLYPVKVDVTEPLRIAIAPSAESKAQLAADFTDRRVQEGETLAAENKLDHAKQTELSDLIVAHTQVLNIALAAVASSDPQTAQKISIDFQARMNERARHLDALIGTTTEEALAELSSTTVAHASSTATVATHSYGDRSNRRPEMASNNNRRKDTMEGSTTLSVSLGRYASTTTIAHPALFAGTTSADETISTSTENTIVEAHTTVASSTSGETDRSTHSHDSGLFDQEAAPILNLAASARASGEDVSARNDHGRNDGNTNDTGHNDARSRQGK